MDAVQLFADVIAQRGKTCVGQYADNPAFRLLADADLIQETGVIQSICCDDCDQPHDAAVVFENGQYGYFCPDLGFVEKDRSELDAFTANISRIVENLADDLNCKRRKSKPISGDTWRIGAIETHAGDIAVYFRPVMQNSDDLSAFISALGKEVSSRFGIVISAIGSLTIPPYVNVPITNIIHFDHSKRQFCIDADIEAIVDLPQI